MSLIKQQECIVCYSNSNITLEDGQKILFHSLPTDERRSEWISKLKIKDSALSNFPDPKVCSLHFNTNQYVNYRRLKRKITLRSNGMPTSVDFFRHEIRLSNIHTEDGDEEEDSFEDNQIPLVVLDDIEDSDMATVIDSEEATETNQAIINEAEEGTENSVQVLVEERESQANLETHLVLPHDLILNSVDNNLFKILYQKMPQQDEEIIQDETININNSNSSSQQSKKILKRNKKQINNGNVLESSLLSIPVMDGYTVQLQRYIYTNPLCRICLQAKADLIYLYENLNTGEKGGIADNSYSKGGPRYNIITAVQTLLGIEVVYGDGLPDHICVECLDLITSFSAFRKKITNQQNTLQNILMQVKDSVTPTLIPPLSDIDLERLDVFRNGEFILKAKKMFEASEHSHNVSRYLPSPILEKIFNVLSNASGLGSKCLKNIEKYVISPPYATGWFCRPCYRTIRGDQESFSQHFAQEHDLDPTDVPFPCDICGNCFQIRDTSGASLSFFHHWIQHFFFYPCQEEFCSKLFPSSKGVLVHKKSGHPDNAKNHQCEKCPRSFHKRSHFITHLKTHLEPEAKKALLNYCNICGKGLSSSLKVHMEAMHNEKRFFKCEICFKQFKRKEILLSHKVKKHPGHEGHACTFCGSGFKTQSEALVHSLNCLRNLQFHCKFCPKKFSAAKQLRLHTKIHKRDEEAICSFPGCNKMFTRKAYLAIHMAVHSEEQAFKCPFETCGMSIRMKSNFLKHLRVHKKNGEILDGDNEGQKELLSELESLEEEGGEEEEDMSLECHEDIDNDTLDGLGTLHFEHDEVLPQFELNVESTEEIMDDN